MASGRDCSRIYGLSYGIVTMLAVFSTLVLPFLLAAYGILIYRARRAT